MSFSSGDDLLRVVNDLNIDLYNLHPNVIKAWFDTDDPNMKNLLNWMCTSLSKENYFSALENAEYLNLENPLTDDECEREMKRIDSEYPGIFDVESNAFDVELIEDEIDMNLEEERHLDELLRINKTLHKEISNELVEETSKEITASLKMRTTQDQCKLLGEKLDELNKKLHKQLEKYGANLYDFEFSPVPNFLSNLDIHQCQENFDNIKEFRGSILDGDFFADPDLESRTNLDISNANDSIENSLSALRDRISQSHQMYLVSKTELEKMKELLMYLNKTSMDTILSLSESAFCKINRKAQEDIKHQMFGMLDKISEKYADYHISQTKLKYAQQELEIFQSKLNKITTIEQLLRKFLSQYLILEMLFIQEKKDIDTSDAFFRKIHRYIFTDLQNCVIRTDKMSQIIQEYENSKTPSNQFKLIHSIYKVLTNGDENFSLNRALQTVTSFKNELNVLENKLFYSDFVDHRIITKELKNNIDILKKFLVCGPTHRIVLVPTELLNVISSIEELLKNQATSIKTALEISSSVKKIPNKWQNYKRQLWMYFYADPQKLFYLLEQIEEEFKKLKRNNMQE